MHSSHFIANSTSYLNAAGFFEIVFLVPIISRIESLGIGLVGGNGVGGGWRAEGEIKHQFKLKEQCYAFSMWHKLIQSTREVKTAMRSSFN